MSIGPASDQQFEAFRADFDALRRELAKRIVGQDEAIQSILTALVVGGHVLLEGMPGTGKTLLVRSLADAVDVSFQRVQCTADLMPADIIGTYVVMETPQGRRTFEFHKGPLFANLVLADHVNRAPPKTQSAFIQAMDEDAITFSTESFALPRPHLLVATQNPLESEGAYPLPDAQIDRFLFKIVLPPPGPEQIEAILERTIDGQQIPKHKVLDAPRLLAMSDLARRVPISKEVRRWAVSVVAATQPQSEQAPPLVRQFVRYGSGPRGALAMVLAAQVHAATAGRNEVTREDLQAVALPALRHRLVLNYDAVAEDISPDAILGPVLQRPVPR
jgi:MoxR-like ATPase